MILVPAIDLIGGRCVRLEQGDFARETAYADDPAQVLALWAEAGAGEAHLVDLDGARAREPRQHDVFVSLARAMPLKLQVAGGFRTAGQVGRVLDAGAARVVIGSLAIDDPDAVTALSERFGADRLVLALDIRLVEGVPMVAAHGWLSDTGQSLDSVIGRFGWIEHLLVTDIARDGMLSGPNVELMEAIARRFPRIALQASGGVASLDDLRALGASGAARAIVGKALWEGRFMLAEGLEIARG